MLLHLAVPLDTFPMDAKIAEVLPAGEGWQYEPKWDGFRCLAFRDGSTVELRGKSGKSLTRYFPDVVQLLLGLPARRFALDGELAIPLGNALSFEALQLRLHPAESRIRKLAKETPAIFICFDILLGPDNRSLIAAPLRKRRTVLEKLFAQWPDARGIFLSPCTHSHAVARKWLSRAGTALDGVVAKHTDETYRPGERAMVKIKRLRTADCVVGGFRRTRRIFIDYLGNDPTSTSVAAYSSRARPGAPVSTPLHWDELNAELDPAKFNVMTVPQRLRRLRRDPWAGIDKLHQFLPKFPR